MRSQAHCQLIKHNARQPCLRLVLGLADFCLALFGSLHESITMNIEAQYSMDAGQFQFPANVHALKAHRLRVKSYSSHSASIALLVAISLSLSPSSSPFTTPMYRGGAGQWGHIPRTENALIFPYVLLTTTQWHHIKESTSHFWPEFSISMYRQTVGTPVQ